MDHFLIATVLQFTNHATDWKICKPYLVCKSWYTVINSEHFVMFYLNNIYRRKHSNDQLIDPILKLISKQFANISNHAERMPKFNNDTQKDLENINQLLAHHDSSSDFLGYSGLVIIGKKVEIEFFHLWEDCKQLEMAFRTFNLVETIKDIICKEMILYEFKPIFQKGEFNYFVLKKRNLTYVIFCRSVRNVNTFLVFETLKLIHRKFKHLSEESKSCEMLEFLIDPFDSSILKREKPIQELNIPKSTQTLLWHIREHRFTYLHLDIIERVAIVKNLDNCTLEGTFSFSSDCSGSAKMEILISLNEKFNNFIEIHEGTEGLNGNYVKRNETNFKISPSRYKIPTYKFPIWPEPYIRNESITYTIRSFKQRDINPIELFFNIRVVNQTEEYSIIKILMGIGVKRSEKVFNLNVKIPLLNPLTNIVGIKKGMKTIGKLERESDNLQWNITERVPNDRQLKCSIFIQIPSTINPKNVIGKPNLSFHMKNTASGFGFHFSRNVSKENFVTHVNLLTFYNVYFDDT